VSILDVFLTIDRVAVSRRTGYILEPHAISVMKRNNNSQLYSASLNLPRHPAAKLPAVWNFLTSTGNFLTSPP
jgi:hypothetical protein